MKVIGLVLVSLTLMSGASSGQDITQTQPIVVSKTVKVPKRHRTRVIHFTPVGRPTPSYVFNTIIPHEAQTWGASYSTLMRRVRCESGGRYWAENGQYKGVGQFAYSTYARGLSTIRTLKVRLVKRDVVFKRSHVTRVWSDGKVDHWLGRKWPVKVTRIYKGTIHPYYLHAWAQVRIMAQAIRGISNVHDSEWSCR